MRSGHEPADRFSVLEWYYALLESWMHANLQNRQSGLPAAYPGDQGLRDAHIQSLT